MISLALVFSMQEYWGPPNVEELGAKVPIFSEITHYCRKCENSGVRCVETPSAFGAL